MKLARIAKTNRLSQCPTFGAHRRFKGYRNSQGPSPFLSPRLGLEGEALPLMEELQRPPAGEMTPGLAKAEIIAIERQQSEILPKIAETPQLRGSRLFFAGGSSGLGLHELVAGINLVGRGGIIAAVCLERPGSAGMVMVEALRDYAKEKGIGGFYMGTGGIDVFHTDKQTYEITGINDRKWEKISVELSSIGMTHIDYYFDRIAAAVPGMLPGNPAIFIPDVDIRGRFFASETLFQWKIPPVDEKVLARNNYFMSVLGNQFAERVLERRAEIPVSFQHYAGWRGGYNLESRNPTSPHYGQEGSYSGALAPAKSLLRDYVREQAEDERKNEIAMYDYPTMPTPALGAIPGGWLVHAMRQKLLAGDYQSMARLGLRTFQFITTTAAPFVSLDRSERLVEEDFRTRYARVTNDPGSKYFWKNLVDL